MSITKLPPLSYEHFQNKICLISHFYKIIRPVPNYYIPVYTLFIFQHVPEPYDLYFRTNNFEKVAALVVFVQGD